MDATKKKIRLDDVGSASKRWEYHAPRPWQNIWPLHSRYFYGRMAPYAELTSSQLEHIFHAVAVAHRTMTVCVTAYWVTYRGSVKAFNRKFPAQATVIAMFARRGVIEVAAHGMTHMVVGQHRPRWIGSNRFFHRERGPWHDEAKRSIESWLELPVTRFVEPGLVAVGDEEVFHDKEFSTDWEQGMHRLRKVLA